MSGTPSYDSITPINGKRHPHDDDDHDDEDDVEASRTPHGSYNAAAIRAEFQTYHALLPKPDKLLQQQHSTERLRAIIEQYNNRSCPTKPIAMPRFLQTDSEGGIKPHHALCTLLLEEDNPNRKKKTSNDTPSSSSSCEVTLASCLVSLLSAGRLHRQLHIPADFIRDQFGRVAHAVADHYPPARREDPPPPDVLRHAMRNAGLPIPNFFLDPEDPKQFPPHIALLVILQEDQQESRHLRGYLYRLAWLVFAATALVLRLVLEVIGGAGAIWGGSEVFHLRSDDNTELWRVISIAVGVFCFLRFVTLNAPQQEDEGDILGPAGPWSLRRPARLRAVCEHPFHYFARAQAPYQYYKEQ
eukprot:scaffold537_cov175-Amphora_coffeaeformis.AAC.5